MNVPAHRLVYVMLALIVASSVSAREDYVTARRPVVPDVAPGKVEVVEYFWYGCNHCYNFEPYLENWLEKAPPNVVFRRVPAMLGQRWLIHGKAYFISQALDKLDTLHAAKFKAIHEERKSLRNEKSLRAFYIAHGVAPGDFDRIYNSEELNQQVEKAVLKAKRLGINSVPIIVVNGKYLVSARTAGSLERILDVVNQLIRKESTANRSRTVEQETTKIVQ